MTADPYDPYASYAEYTDYGSTPDGGYPGGHSRRSQPYGGQNGRPPSTLPGGGRAARHRRNQQPGGDPYPQQPYGDGGGWGQTAPAPPPPQPTGEWAAGYQPASNAPVGWQPAPSGQWQAFGPPSSPPPQRYFNGHGQSTGIPGTGSWGGQAVAAPPAWPGQPGRASADTGQLGGRVTPSRASRHSRQTAVQRGQQVWQKRLTIAGAYLVAMVICWFYVFPWLENILPSEF